MAIYHLSSGFVSRTTGRSAVQSAAYLTGSCLTETRRGIIADYRNRSSDIVFTQTLAPEQVPKWARTLTVWDKLESYEDEYASLRYKTPDTQAWYQDHAQTAQTIVVALPKELTPEDWKALVTEFAQERFVSRGLIVTLAIHNDEGNPHAHLQIARRAINAEGQWSWAKDRAITTKAALIETRALWAEKVNHYLEREGFDERVSHQSYVDLGLSFEATRHEGWFARKLERNGEASRIIDENQSIQKRNKDRALLEPEAILTELTAHKATFSAMDLAKTVQTRLADDTKLASAVYESALSKAMFVGSSLDGHARYTSQTYADKEQEALALIETLQHQKPTLSIDPAQVEVLLNTTYHYLNEEQKAAVIVLCQDNSFSVLIGRAGTGKTTTLKAVVDCHQKSGYHVIGLSLSAVAAENLAVEADVPAETIAFYLNKWTRLEETQNVCWSLHDSDQHHFLMKELSRLTPYQVTNKHLILVDEAGMVGTPQWHQLLYFAQKAGAKLIAIGDDHQFKAIEAGDLFRKLKEISGESVSSLQNIQRQKSEWMKAVSLALSELKTYEALSVYENHGCIEKVQRLEEVAQRFVEQCHKTPDKTGLLLTYTNDKCAQLNQSIRKLLKERGLIDAQEFYLNKDAFSVNDRITFLSNDRSQQIKTYHPNTQRSQPFTIKNGTQGQILAIKPLDSEQSEFEITVEITPHLHARFLIAEYDDFKHSYALTLHKAQGQTVDWTYIVASKNMDAFATYVALTRHRDDARLFYEEKEFTDFKALQTSLGRLSYKDLVIDYTILPDHQTAWENVQAYKLLGQDLTATIQETNWEGYHALKQEREGVGKIILDEWDTHQPFARQAGLTFEAIAIQCGLKARPLSLLEIEARNNVQTYADKALAARLLWRAIRASHPGKHCYQHEHYKAFTELRQARNALAKTILDNKAVHKCFVQEMYSQGISWKTLAAQAKQQNEFKVYERPLTHAKENEHASRYREAPIYPQYANRLEPAQVKAELQQKIGLLAHSLLGKPNTKNAREWRYGNHGSIAIHINGTRQGLYANFESGSYGGPLKLIEDHLHLDYKEAYKWAIEWLGHKQTERFVREKALSSPTEKQNAWVPIYPVPLERHHPDLAKERSLSYVLTKHQQREVARYPYLDAANNLLGYTVRLENPEGEKIVLPLTYCQNPKGQQEWRWQGFSDDRPLYGLNRLAEYPDKPVLVVEGEKTANAAQSLFPETVVISWPGGSGAVAKVDWSPLIGKAIVLWPDNDEPGHKAMEKIENQLSQLHEEKNLNLQVERVSLPLDTPPKWDLADPLPKGWTLETLTSLLPIGPRIQEPILDETYVHAIADKYALANKNLKIDAYFIQETHTRYQGMLAWCTALDLNIAPNKKQQLLEKSVLTQTLIPEAKREYCFGSPHLSKARRSEELALIGSSLMQQNPEHKETTKHWLSKANALLQEQKQIGQESLIQSYQQKFPEGSLRQLQLAAAQHAVCQNTLDLSLHESAQKIILQAAQKLEHLEEQGLFLKAVHTVIQEQTHSSTKETFKTVEPMLQRQCMQQMILKSESSEKTIENSVKIVKETQKTLEKRFQELVQERMRQVQRSMENERER